MVVGLGIVTSVRQCRADADVCQGGIQQGHEPIGIGPRAAADEHTDHEVAATIESGFQLGVVAVSYGLPSLCDAIATANVVAAGVAAVQSGRVQRRALEALTPAEKPLDGGVEESPGPGLA